MYSLHMTVHDVCMYAGGWTYGRTDGRTDGRMDRWID